MSIFWCAYEIYRDPELLHNIRNEAAACITLQSPHAVHFNTDALVHQPLLQAVIAETLRLRIHGFILRYPEKNLEVNEWIFPKEEIVLTCATTAHMNDRIWSSAERGGRPPSEFYPGRFLSHKGAGVFNFSMEKTDGAWMAFGGGVHACPGRHFAKRQALHTLALLVTLYDVDIMDHGKVGMSATKFGFGLLGPSRKIAARMRLRNTNN
jgi:cytochrome P450